MKDNKNQSPKERILNGFSMYFGTYGLKKTTVDEVATELKISKKTIYNYFNSKKAIYDYLVENSSNRHQNRMEKSIASRGETGLKVKDIINDLFTGEIKRVESGISRISHKFDIDRTAHIKACGNMLRQDTLGGREEPEEETVRKYEFVSSIIDSGIQLVRSTPEREIGDDVAKAVLSVIIPKE